MCSGYFGTLGDLFTRAHGPSFSEIFQWRLRVRCISAPVTHRGEYSGRPARTAVPASHAGAARVSFARPVRSFRSLRTVQNLNFKYTVRRFRFRPVVTTALSHRNVRLRAVSNRRPVGRVACSVIIIVRRHRVFSGSLSASWRTIIPCSTCPS